jgi:hypothetical protein
VASITTSLSSRQFRLRGADRLSRGSKRMAPLRALYRLGAAQDIYERSTEYSQDLPRPILVSLEYDFENGKTTLQAPPAASLT